MHSYMFDTNVFNHILDGMAELSGFVGRAKFYATHVQIDELRKTGNEKRKAALLQVFEEITNIKIPTESFVLGGSRLGETKLSEQSLYEPIKLKLDQLNGSKPNNVQDALIAETAIKNGFTFVTHDSELFDVATKFGAACSNIHQVLKDLTGAVAG